MLCMRRGREGRGGGASGKHMLYYNAKKANLMMALAFFLHTRDSLGLFLYEISKYSRLYGKGISSRSSIFALYPFKLYQFRVSSHSPLFLSRRFDDSAGHTVRDDRDICFAWGATANETKKERGMIDTEEESHLHDMS